MRLTVATSYALCFSPQNDLSALCYPLNLQQVPVAPGSRALGLQVTGA